MGAAAAALGQRGAAKRLSDEQLRSKLDSGVGGFFGRVYQKEFDRRKSLGNFGLGSTANAGGTSDMGGRIEGLESRIKALESGSGSATSVAGIGSAEEAAATAEAMGGNIPPAEIESTPISTGRFSEQAQGTANAIFGTEEARKTSIGQIPAGIASGNQQTVGAIADLMNENI